MSETGPIQYSEGIISRVLVNPLGMFPPRRFLAVENVSWGLGLPWEADLVVMNPKGYCQEVEIKISLADLKRDAGKRKHLFRRDDNGVTVYSQIMKKFWYAMPEQVWQRAAEKLVPMPPDAGVIIIKIDPGIPRQNIPPKLVSAVAVPAQTNKWAKPLGDKRKYALARLGVLRYWDRT